MKTQLIEGMPNKEYHAVDAASHSRLVSLRRSAAYCKWRMDNPEESDALLMGDATHTAVLEPNRFSRQFTGIAGDWRTTAAKKLIAEAQVVGMTCLKIDQMLAIAGMRESLMAHPRSRFLLTTPGMTEASGFWVDDEHGIDCRLRADRLVEVPGYGRVCIDLKTTEDASPDAFQFSMRKWGYHIQGAWYLDGLAKLGAVCDHFVVVVVEKKPPHCVAVYAIGDDSLEQGQKECRRLLAQYAGCVKSGAWPGYSDKIVELDIPVWAFDDDEVLTGELR